MEVFHDCLSIPVVLRYPMILASCQKWIDLGPANNSCPFIHHWTPPSVSRRALMRGSSARSFHDSLRSEERGWEPTLKGMPQPFHDRAKHPL